MVRRDEGVESPKDHENIVEIVECEDKSSLDIWMVYYPEGNLRQHMNFGEAKEDLYLKSFCGTRVYMAPEIWFNQPAKGPFDIPKRSISGLLEQ
ncbi:hypothetical protein NQ176_g7605 [Zarea fungicola]|uniref:Uncharacterized protein n=1 Tax=Zarea fungicola TaxID=93591 RepID=A0ACC1MX78_9HYPO|nr:hypothetical protein NQ176_g7605 [Lecanicillium fungicola]